MSRPTVALVAKPVILWQWHWLLKVKPFFSFTKIFTNWVSLECFYQNSPFFIAEWKCYFQHGRLRHGHVFVVCEHSWWLQIPFFSLFSNFRNLKCLFCEFPYFTNLAALMLSKELFYNFLQQEICSLSLPTLACWCFINEAYIMNFINLLILLLETRASTADCLEHCIYDLFRFSEI